MALEHVQNYNGLKRNVQETATATTTTATQINKNEMYAETLIHFFNYSDFVF